MRGKRTCALSMIGLFVASGAAVAATQVEGPLAIPVQSTNWSDSFSVPQFDPSLGTLLSIDIQLKGEVAGSVELESTDARPATVTAELKALIELKRPDNSILLAMIPEVDQTVDLDAFDGVIDFAGPSGFSVFGLTGDTSDSIVTTDPADLAAFTGPGNILLPIMATGQSRVTGAGNLVALLRTSAGAEVTVVYEYEPVQPRPASLGDFVWEDLNGDGIQDAGEPGVENVEVELQTCDGTVLATTTTGPNGEYLFDNLTPGDYRVRFVLPSGYSFTLQDQGGDDAVDSDADPGTGITACTNLESGESDLTLDAGLTRPVVDCGECDGKVTELTLEYLGDVVDAHIQVYQHKGEKVFDDIVQPNETFTLVGVDKQGTLGPEITIKVNGAVNAKIHTSCSQPIGPGLIKGDFLVVEGYSRNGGLLCPLDDPGDPPGDDDCECEGKVTTLTLKYLGDKDNARIQVYQHKGEKVFDDIVQPNETFTFVGVDKQGTLGPEITIKVNGSINAKIHTSCSQPIGPGLIKGDFLVVEGYSRNGGLLCPLDDPGDPPGDDDCECEGKVTTLTLKYLGDKDNARIQVYQHKGEKVFDDIVQPNETFTLVGVDKQGTLGPEITIKVNGAINAKIHTSCSQPIGPGLIKGDFLVVEGYSRNGGLLCPLE